MINEADFSRYLSIKGDVSEQTIRHCRIRIRVINRWLGERELTKELIEAFLYELRERGRGNAALNTYLLCFQHIAAYQKDRGLTVVPVDSFKAFKKIRKKPIILLTQEEVENILSVKLTYKPFRGKDTSLLDTIYHAFTMTLAYTGSRFDETASLKVMYCDLTGGRLIYPANTTKNKEERSLFITEPLVGYLKVLLKDKKPEDLVFQNMMGNKLREQEYCVDLKRRAEAANVTKRVHPHLFRHTYATNLYIATRDIGLVQKVLGHKDIKSTQLYVKIADEIISQSMYTHPFVRNYVGAQTTIRYIEEHLRNMKLDEHRRFHSLKILQATQSLISGMHPGVK